MNNEELAIFGGTPIREEKIYYGKQYIDNSDIEAVVNVLKGPLITCGPKVAELESQLCNITNARYAVVLSSGTAALHAACYAAGIGEGDKVITTPITFAATANAILYQGGTPVFADVNPKTYNIDPEEIKSKISTGTKAVIAVDFTGQAASLDEIKEICRENDLIFIEDGAHSIGTKYKNEMVGSIADMTTFSFHPVKNVTGGEGGAVITNNFEYYKKIILFRSHCITRDLDMMEDKDQGNWYYEQIGLGYNYRLTDIQAALLLSQLKKLAIFSKRRKEIVTLYNEAFSDIPEIMIQDEIKESDTARHLYIIKLDLKKLSCGRKEIYEALWAENICCNVHYIPVYYLPYYKNMGYKKGLCPIAEELYESIISIPIYYSLSNDDVRDVINGVKKVIQYYSIDN